MNDWVVGWKMHENPIDIIMGSSIMFNWVHDDESVNNVYEKCFKDT